MIAKTLTLLMVVGAVLADKPLAGVDPNTLSCDPAGQKFLLLPHFTDCAKYFMCAHGKEVEMPCPGPTLFDFELQGCNWAAQVVCQLRDEIGIEGSGDEDESDISRSFADLTRPNMNPILNCARIDTAATQLAYRGDCQRYWRCINGVPQTVYCTDGLYFNQAKQQCDFEANANCAVVQDDELQGEFLMM